MSHKVYKFRSLDNEEHHERENNKRLRRMDRMWRRKDKEVFFVVDTNKKERTKTGS